MYAIVENVDLGYHIVVGYNSREKAICQFAGVRFLTAMRKRKKLKS